MRTICIDIEEKNETNQCGLYIHVESEIKQVYRHYIFIFVKRDSSTDIRNISFRKMDTLVNGCIVTFRTD